MVDGDTMMDDVMTSAAGGQQLFHKDAGGGVDAATLIPAMHEEGIPGATNSRAGAIGAEWYRLMTPVHHHFFNCTGGALFLLGGVLRG